MPLAPIPRRITSPPPATVVHHWPLPLPRNELRAPKRMKPCPHPISRTLLFSSLSSCLEDAEDSTRSQRSSANLNLSRCFETISPLFFSLSARGNSSPEEKRNESKESKGMVGKGRNVWKRTWRESLDPSRNRYADGDHGEKGVWEERRWKAMKNGDTQSRPGRQPPGSRPSRNNAKQTASGGGY